MDKRMLTPLIAALALAALPAAGARSDKIVVDQPPPMTSAEDTPPQREGYVWAPGYWNYTGSKYEWTKGHWVQSRKGYRYTSPRWVQEDNRWTLYPESWVKNEDDKEKTVAKDSSMPALR
jgi:hypothetical protein